MDYAWRPVITLSFGSAPTEAESTLAEADERAAADHQMVEQLDVKQLARFARRDGQSNSSGEGVGSPLGWL